MSTTTQYPDALSLSGNLKQFIISSSAEVTFLLEQGATTILNDKYQPDADSLITIDIKSVVERLLSIVIPTDSTTVTEQVLGVGDFSATIDGGSPITFRVIKGGVAEIEVTPSAWLDSHFLTWQPQQKSIVQQAPEWIGIYPISSGAIKCTGYFADGTTETVTYASLDAGKLYSINTSWGNVDGAMAKVPIAWDVAFFVGATQKTPTQRYSLRNATDEEHGFIWVNTLGGIDSSSFTGAQEEDEKLEHKDAKYYDESISEYDIDKGRDIKQSTGYLTTEECFWLKDFFYSRSKYLVRPDGSLRKIAVISSKVISVSQDDEFNFEFTYRMSADCQLLNLDRTYSALPAPEGLADFFLTDLLSGLTEASYSDNLIMAVQSPFAVGWQKLSLAQLWGATLPLLVDNVTIKIINGKLTAVTSTSVVESLPVEFTSTNTPALEDYPTEYAPVFGQIPKLILLIYDEDGNELESQAVPIRYKTDGVISRIAWDLPDTCSGKIIISK